MNLTYIRIDLVRQLRDISTWMFVVALPAAMLLLIGQIYATDAQAGHGNVQFYTTISMAAYSAATATTAIAGTAAAESLAGWGRQLALAGQRTWQIVANKTMVATICAAFTTAIVFAVGAITGAQADSWEIWTWSYLIVLIASPLFAVYGFAVAMWFRTETAVGVASALITFFAFFGNVFMPLSGNLLKFARFTPMYGYVGLSRYPLTEGTLPDGKTIVTDEVWWLVANVVAWLVIFTVAAIWGTRRARASR